MTKLRNIAQANGKLNKVEPWHERLAALIPATAVYYLFMPAELKEGILFFNDAELLDRAKNFRNELESIMPYVVLASRASVIPYETRQKLGADSKQHKHRG